MAKVERLNRTNADPAEQARPFRRRVFYIPGYDPIHPRRYRELYRKEGREQATISAYRIDLTAKKSKGAYGWHVAGAMPEGAAETDVEVMVWSDIVRESMDQGTLATYVQMVRTAWAYIGTGVLFRLMQLRKGPIIAALYPIGMLLLQLLIACLAGRGVGQLAGQIHPAAGWIAGLATVLLVLRGFRRYDNKLFAYYLMHDYAYSAETLGANRPELEARMAGFRIAISDALRGDYDEVLVVGHSSGAHLAVSILADLIRLGLPEQRPALAFLSLGQVVPMVSFLPRAQRLRADLRYLSARDELTWVDVTAPGDGCAFALCDPVAVTGVAPPDKRWPLVVSAAFTQTLSPGRWRSLRWKFFRLHFQYLCAFDNLSGGIADYDYFRITAGPVTLADRFAGRNASKSRVETPVSGHRTVA